MQRFKNILVVYNNVVGDDDTLTQAASLAKRNGAELTLVEVIKDPLPTNVASERHKHLMRMVGVIENQGIKTQTLVINGTPFLEVIRQVLRNRHDLVIMPAEGDVGFKHLFFGNTSMHLMRKCPCPVWITKPGARNDYKRILAAVDPDLADPTQDWLSIEIMDLATSLTEIYGGELHIAHTWDFSGSDLDTMRSETTSTIRERLVRKNERMRRHALDLLLSRYPLKDIPHRVHLEHGAPGTKIPELVEAQKIDLTVIGTVAHTGIPGFFIGSTAEFVLRQVNCAVMTVKPTGFNTPVTLSA